MSFRQLCYFLIFFCLQNGINSDRKVSIRVTNLKCKHHPALYNGSLNCFIKPFRNGTQLTTILYTFQRPCHDFWVHLVVYYKFGGSTQYRQWMFNYDEDLCAYYDGRGKPGVFYAIIWNVMKRISPRTIHKCPYIGEEGAKKLDIGAVISNVLPQVIPTGDYRLYLRFHTTKNETFLEVTIGFHLDATNPMDAINMGRK